MSEDDAERPCEPGGGISGLEDALEKTAFKTVVGKQPREVVGKQQLEGLQRDSGQEICKRVRKTVESLGRNI